MFKTIQKIKNALKLFKIYRKINNGDLRDIIIDYLNKKIDLQHLNEKEERQLLYKIYDVFRLLIIELFTGKIKINKK